jgi:hypothetical protein
MSSMFLPAGESFYSDESRDIERSLNMKMQRIAE